jgi:heme A synthase
MNPQPPRRAFQRLTLATAIAVYLLIIVGAVVRVSGSGLGCPDWPLCHGQFLPPPHIEALIEFSHRAVAATTGLLMIATLLMAWRSYRQRRWILGPAVAAVALLVIQMPLGGIIVLTELEPLIVAFHLGMAMLIFACELTVAAATRMDIPALRFAVRRPGRLLIAAMTALFVLLLTGALVVGSNAQLACPTWPLCAGRLLPPANGSPLVAIQLLHRYTVAAVTLLIAAVIVAVFRTPEASQARRAWAIVLGAAFAVQVAVGALQVVWLLPAALRALHLAAASAVWAALVLISALTLLRPNRSTALSSAESPVLASDPLRRLGFSLSLRERKDHPQDGG